MDTTREAREESRSWLFRMLDKLVSREKPAVAVFSQVSCRHRNLHLRRHSRGCFLVR